MLTKSCPICGKMFTAKRNSAIYDSNACKMKAQRMKKRALNQAKSRTPDMYEFRDLKVVEKVSPKAYRKLSDLWAVYGKDLGIIALDIAWDVIIDNNLVPDEYITGKE